VVGFDPGLSGAFAFYCPGAPHVVAARDLPVAGRPKFAPEAVAA
jgi:hypothetical protein